MNKDNDDVVINYLVNKSSLTKIQFETFLIHFYGKEKKINLSDKIKMRKRNNLSKGSFLRSLSQAKENFEKSIYTLLLAQYIGLLNKNSISQIFKIGKLMENIKNENIIIQTENKYKIIEIINKIVSIIIEL